MHTNSTAAFARSGRLTPEEMNLGAETRDVWRVVTDNKQLRLRLMQTPVRHKVYCVRKESDRSDPLEILDELIVWMAACGFPEATVMLLITHLKGVVARCYTGNAHRSIEELDREECKLEALENELTLHRLQIGENVTSELLEREAVCNELEANLQLERAQELRRVARSETRVLPFRRSFPRPIAR